ncbi:GNAT family N-acetyltransferase [Aquamicrobium soli]|jgi:RimJ/RimL family protein N-acetyltransferase|uniref:GNAT family N-acetyltransferase n=1 Tax=Aquamicrobium soli TaxID=1811518 RepID=A0ABV7KCP2_9HYPH
MTPIRTARLILRDWREGDRALFHRINSDEQVMEFFPFRRDRAQSDAKMDELQALIDRDGYGFAAVEIAETGECAGFAGITGTGHIPSLPEGMVEIGWRLAPEFWGRGIATEAARAWLGFGFDTLGLEEIVSFAVKANHRSTAVMERLGMRAEPALDFDHPSVPDSHPHLKRHAFYRLKRADWKA